MNDSLHAEEPVRHADGASWTKSSLSHANGNCVEIANIEDGQVGMRDSKNATGPVLGISREEWRAFLGGIRDGEFDKFSA